MSAPFPVPFLYKHKYADELIATANAIATPGKGILAADESTGTIGARFKDIKVENSHENRKAYRDLLFTTEGLEKYISGVILYEETLFDKVNGKLLVQPLIDKKIILGIKTDLGTKPIPGTDGETYTQGLTDLDKRSAAYYKAGARFCKWRAVLKISRNTPSPQAIDETAQTLAKYAAISQDNGLVPIVEPEILMDGDHTVEVCQYWTEKTVAACYKALNEHNVLLEGTLLKPNMVAPGAKCPVKPTPDMVAKATFQALQRTVPPAMPGVNFLSGGHGEEDATVYLNVLNQQKGKKPWNLSFSYGRALQKTCLAVWGGKKENVAKAQQALLVRCRANGEASMGVYKGDAATEMSKKSLFVDNYKY